MTRIFRYLRQKAAAAAAARMIGVFGIAGSISGFALGMVAGLLAGPLPVQAAVAGAGVTLAPHRAVYEFRLVRSDDKRNLTQMSGRMVYEITGSACDGYTQKMRFVTQSEGADGKSSISDVRSSTWEEAFGRRFRFQSSQYQDQKLADEMDGDARRAKDKAAIRVELTKPKNRALDIQQKAYFPVQHSIALLEAAMAGKALFEADIYDGTEDGDQIFATTTVIGRQLSAAAIAKLPVIASAPELRKVDAWPVSMSYFKKNIKKGENRDETPIYEMAFRFYANGVSRRLFIDYGDFAVRGDLKKLVYLKAPACAK